MDRNKPGWKVMETIKMDIAKKRTERALKLSRHRSYTNQQKWKEICVIHFVSLASSQLLSNDLRNVAIDEGIYDAVEEEDY